MAVFVLWLALDTAPPDGPRAAALADGLARLSPAWAAAWLVVRVLGAVVTVPLAEELAFRGFLYRRLIARDFEAVPSWRFSWLAFLLSSLLFGVSHSRWLAGSLAGLLFALAMVRKGRLGDAVLAHATANGLLAAYVLWNGAWSLWV